MLGERTAFDVFHHDRQILSGAHHIVDFDDPGRSKTIEDVEFASEIGEVLR